MLLHARSRPKWLMCVLTLVVFVMSLVQPALAAGPVSTMADAVSLLREYNVIRGDGTGDLQLGSPITRAEMAVILVRIKGFESEVENLKGLNFYPDTTGHWSEGYVASARIRGLVKGFEDGSFRPDEPVTYAQALTLVLRLLDREPDPTNWPTSALLDAMEIGAVPPGFTGVAMLDQPAVRGEIFTSVGMALTSVKTPEGLTFFQQYVDSTPPQLTVTSASSTTGASYQLEGKAEGAVEVMVNGEAVSLTAGTFSKSLSLAFGDNKINLEATDKAGNTAEQEFVVTRMTTAASLTITGPNTVPVGGTASYAVKALNASGQEVSAAGATAQVTGSIGTFDVATGTFTAGAAAGSGSIKVTLGSASATVKVDVLGPSTSASNLAIVTTSGPYTQGMTVKVEVHDANGAIAVDDYGRKITLAAAGLTGLIVTPSEALTEAGVAVFTVKGTQPGQVALAASSTGLATVSTGGKLTTTTNVVLVADVNRLSSTAGQFAKIRAELRDDKGNNITNTSGEDIVIDLELEGGGSLLNSTVRIANNASTSTQTQNDGMYAPSVDAGTATISGKMRSTHDYSISSVTVQTYVPAVGAGTRFRVVPLKSRVDVGTAASYVVELLDEKGSPITSTDYAFQVEVSTSSGEKKVNGIPEGMTVRIGDNNSLNPVKSDDEDSDDVIARTGFGSAIIDVIYDKPGVVTLKVVAASGTSEAYNTDGEADKATGSQSSWITTESSGEAIFKADPNTIKLTVDSDAFGKDAPAASIKAGASKTLTVHAYLAYVDPADTDPDAPRYWTPGIVSTKVALYKNGSKVSTATARDGKADFTITASGTANTEDVYVVKDDSGAASPLDDSNEVLVRTDDSAPAGAGQPIMRGVPSYTTDQVLATDDFMEIELPVDPSEWYVVVKVYAEGTSSAVYTSGPVNVSGGLPTIEVPKSALPAGMKSYYVKYRNGYGESTEKGVLSSPVTNSTYTSGVSISSAKYDAVAQILYLSGNGFSTADTIYPEKIRIVDTAISDPDADDDDHPGIAWLSGATTVSDKVKSSQYALDVSGIPDPELEKLATFAGASVKVSADAGWYQKKTGQMANEDLNNSVSGMAYITHAAYDEANRRLVITGRGFKSGTLQKARVWVETHKLSDSGMSVTVSNDTEIWVTLNNAAEALVEDDATVTVHTEDGWFTDSSSSTSLGKMAAADGITIFGYVRPTSVTFDNAGNVKIWGSGFVGGNVAEGAVVKIVDLHREGTHEIVLTGGTVSGDGRSVSFTIPAEDLNEFLTNYKSKVYLVAVEGWFEVPVNGSFRETAGIGVPTLKLRK